jgi:hypothetical protein
LALTSQSPQLNRRNFARVSLQISGVPTGYLGNKDSDELSWEDYGVSGFRKHAADTPGPGLKIGCPPSLPSPPDKQNFIMEGLCLKLIPLSKGKYAKVCDCRYEIVSKYRWRLLSGNKAGANTSRKTGPRKLVVMHRLVNATPDGFATITSTTTDLTISGAISAQQQPCRTLAIASETPTVPGPLRDSSPKQAGPSKGMASPHHG